MRAIKERASAGAGAKSGGKKGRIPPVDYRRKEGAVN